MGKIGGVLIVLGAGSYILPLMGRQFILVSIFPAEMQPFVGGAMIGLGAILCVLALKRKKKEEKK